VVAAASDADGTPDGFVTYAPKSSSEAWQAPFRLDSLEDVPPPSGCEGTWHRYVIRQGDNVIVGLRAGERSEVSGILDEYVNRLNMRFAKHISKTAR
jgi:hypothetical protein